MRDIITTFSVFLISVYSLHGQNISDDFQDGDFTSNPTWLGDVDKFIVNGASELQLFDDAGGESVLYLNAVTADSTQWEFYVRQEFAPSSSNYAEVILRSNSIDLAGSYNGYFLKMGGESGDTDALELYRKDGNTSELLFRGNDGELGGDPSGGRFRITVNFEGDWEIWADYTGASDFTLLGTAQDNTYLEGQYFGFHCTYTSTRADKFYFDDILFGPLFVDEEPPVLLGAEPISETEVEVSFDEPLEESIAENASNYQINNGIGAPVSAVLQEDLKKVILTLSQFLVSGEEYQLLTSGITDINGNSASNQTTNFLFFEPEPGAYKELVINEIFADPTPVVGLPDAEFIELFNASESYFELENWKLVNTDVERNLLPFLLEPGAYLIICDLDDQVLFEDFGQVMGLESFTALSNSGDSLTVLNADGTVVDWVTYSDNWYNDPVKAEGGFSLELINPYAECGGAENWSASESSNGGTPGIQNSIFNDTPDVSPPELTDYAVINPQEIELQFSEAMNQTSLETAIYTWNQGVITANVQVSTDLKSVKLEMSPALETGVNYKLSIDGPADCEGNALTDTSISILIGEIPEYGELVISEIMADPSPVQTLPDAEYFELVNIGKRAIELSGLSLNDIQFTRNAVLFPGDYLVCVSSDNLVFYPDGYELAEMSSTYLTNSGRELVLINQLGDELDRVNYSDSWYNDPDKSDGGFSLERKNLTEICRDSGNWSASDDVNGGTPGAVNSVNTEETDQTAPNALSVLVENPQNLRIIFNEPLDSTRIDEIQIDIEPPIEVIEVLNIAPEYRSIQLSFQGELMPETVYSLTISNYADCTGNLHDGTDHFSFGLPEDGAPGDILINEVLFNPRTGGSDFVEIVNVSQKIVSLQSWRLQNQDQVTDVLTEEPVSLLPGKYLVLTRDNQNIFNEYPSSVRSNFLEMDDTPSFGNSSGSVLLLNSNLEIIDQFDYNESFHFELLNSVKGVSLERLSFTRPTNDPGNWTSASEQVGFATPGYLNSQYNPEGTSNGFFDLEREVFSPDNDGFQDVLLINYQMNKSGAVATIKIFDRRGREIKELTNKLYLGTEGTITWDGLTDRGTKARIGPHIIYIDVYTADGYTKTEKLPCIVAGKLNN